MELGKIGALVFLIAMVCMWGYFIFLSRTRGDMLSTQPFVSVFKERMSFPEAIQALTQGKCIRRFENQKCYLKVTTTLKGVSSDEWATMYRGELNSTRGVFFQMEDVLSNDWIIED